MATLEITAKQWDEALGSKGAAQPGDTVKLLPDEYVGRHFPILRSGDPDAPILVTAQPGVRFDGEYKYPAGTAANTGPGGEVIYKGLIQARTSNIHLDLTNAELTRSRGHGVHVYGTAANPLQNVQVIGLILTDLRSAGIRFDYANNIKALRNYVQRAGNYYPEFREGSKGGWPMTINAVACEGVELAYNTVTDTWGEGVQSSRGCKNADIHHNLTGRLMGVHYYPHGGDNIRLYCNVAIEWGDYLRAGSPPDLFALNPGEKQYEGKQNLGMNGAEMVNNLGIGGYHNFAVWAGGAAQLANALIAHNTSITAKPGAKRTGHGAILVRGAENVKNVRFVANMLYQPDGNYGAIAKLADVKLSGNGYDGVAPAAWKTDLDLFSVPLFNPDADVTLKSLNTKNYHPTQAAGLLKSTGVETDFYGRQRRHYSPGAFEYIAPQPPTPPDPPVPPAERRARLTVADLTETQVEVLKELLAKVEIDWL